MAVSGNSTTIDYYNADVVSAQDYYPFGMIQPGRSYNAAGYRYGFNGKENDNDVKGEGNQQDYGMRIYDPRVGRFLSVDPITKEYPELTPYQFASNRPIDGIDLDGLEYSPAGDVSANAWQYFSLHKLAEKNGEDPFKYVKGVAKQTGKGSILTLTLAGDIVVAKGWLSRIAMGATLAGAFEHNRATTEEGRFEQDKRSYLALIETAQMLGLGKVAGGLFRLVPWAQAGKITGEVGVVWKKARAAMAGDLSAAAELRVAKGLSNSGKNVHFIDSDLGNAANTGTFDFVVDGVNTDVKRIAGIGSIAAKDIAKGVKQVGAGGNVIVVRPENSNFTYEQYVDFVNKFKPKQPVKIQVVNESALPALGPQ